MYSRHQLRREATLSDRDLGEVRKCRRPQNRLGFAYQLSFVRVLNRFPAQHPFEVIDELVEFAAVQLGVPARLMERYCQRQQAVSEHRRAIVAYLGLRDFGDPEVAPPRLTTDEPRTDNVGVCLQRVSRHRAREARLVAAAWAVLAAGLLSSGAAEAQLAQIPVRLSVEANRREITVRGWTCTVRLKNASGSPAVAATPTEVELDTDGARWRGC